MKNTTSQKWPKRWLLIWAAILVMGSAIIVSYAEYTFSSSSMKRVVVAMADQGMMFSSNYLSEGGSESYHPKYVQADSSAEYYQADVYLWNYSPKNPAKCYPTDIDYKVELKLTNPTGAEDYSEDLGSRKIEIYKGNELVTSITAADLSNGKYTKDFTDTLAAGEGDESAQNLYLVRFYGWDVLEDTSICLQMIAKPDRSEGAYKDLKDLGGIIGIRELSGSGSGGWEAYISEVRNSEYDNSDGYNLIVTGSGKAEIVIKWNVDKVQVNKYFNTNKDIFGMRDEEISFVIPDSQDENRIAQMKINADVSKYRSRYNFQIYLKNGEKNEDSAAFFAPEGTEGAWVTYSITAIE